MKHDEVQNSEVYLYTLVWCVTSTLGRDLLEVGDLS